MRITEAGFRTVIRAIILKESQDAAETGASPGAKRKIFVLVGPPSIGKSHWVEAYHPDTFWLSRDKCVDTVREPHGLSYSDMFSPQNLSKFRGEIDRLYRSLAGEALASGKDIIVDMTNMGAKARRRALSIIRGREGEFETIAVVFPFVGAESAVKRVSQWRAKKAKEQGGSKTISPEVIDSMMGAYEPVTPAEGFDRVIEFDNRATLRDLAAQADAEEAAERAAAGGEEATALAENCTRRWSQIAGLL